MGETALAWIEATDPRMAEVDALRHAVLFAPFGIPRDDAWGDAGEDRRHVVALRNGGVVGYACLITEPSGLGHVRQVCVRSDAQGLGVGRAMMRAVEEHAAGLGIRLLWLNARVTAEPFYLRLGYATVSDTPFPSGRTGVPHVRMERPLGGEPPRVR